MDILKKQYCIDGKFALFIRVTLSEEEQKGLTLGGLGSYHIQTQQSFLTPLSFKQQLNNVKNRWGLSVRRTTGYVFFDNFVRVFSRLGKLITGVFRLFFGTRSRFSDLMIGAEFRTNSLEELRETEVFVFSSIAAVHSALEFINLNDEIETYENRDYIKNIAGLSFAGGSFAASQFAIKDLTRFIDPNGAEGSFFESDVIADDMGIEGDFTDGADFSVITEI